MTAKEKKNTQFDLGIVKHALIINDIRELFENLGLSLVTYTTHSLCSEAPHGGWYGTKYLYFENQPHPVQFYFTLAEDSDEGYYGFADYGIGAPLKRKFGPSQTLDYIGLKYYIIKDTREANIIYTLYSGNGSFIHSYSTRENAVSAVIRQEQKIRYKILSEYFLMTKKV